MQRWLKFVKYLPSYQWEPHVFTPENPSFAVRDPSLEKDIPIEAEVMRLPIWEPYELFFKMSSLLGSKNNSTPTALAPSKKKSVFQRLSTWVRGNLFIPDPRIFWVRPAVKFLSDYIRDNGITVMVTTGPPHSMHLIGLRLKKKYPHLRWVADFRDPWTEWGMWDTLMVSPTVRAIHKKMESRVLAQADEIITITPFYVRRFEQLSGKRVRLLTNGYDEDDFRGIVYRRDDKFIIRHVGLINEKCDPRPFMRALQLELKEHPAFAEALRLEFIGEVHPDFRDFVGANPDLTRVTVFTGNVPHDALIPLYGSSSLLLLILTGYKDAEGFLPGKLFEYFASGLPVLGVGPAEGDAARLLKETDSGVMIETADTDGIRQALRNAFAKWQKSPLQQINTNPVRRFSRKHITGELADILSQTTP